MKTIYNKSTKDELISRINTLNENSTAQWGEMNIYQMLKHCISWEEMILGKKRFKRIFLGRLFGKMSLKGMIGNEKPLQRNIPTLAGLKVKEKDGDIVSDKKKWIALIEENTVLQNPEFVHPFCGRMTKEEIGYLAYKHTDHHLRQFNS